MSEEPAKLDETLDAPAYRPPEQSGKSWLRRRRLLLASGCVLLAAGAYAWLHFANPNGVRVWNAFRRGVLAGNMDEARRHIADDLMQQDKGGAWHVMDCCERHDLRRLAECEARSILRSRRCYLGLPGREIVDVGECQVFVEGGRITGFWSNH